MSSTKSRKRKASELNQYIWIVWRDCRIAGHVKAFSEREALIKSKEKFGERVFVERAPWTGVKEVSETTES